MRQSGDSSVIEPRKLRLVQLPKALETGEQNERPRGSETVV